MKPMLANQSHFTTIKNLTTSLLLFLVSLTLTAQTVHTVDNRPQSGAQFTTVTAAIAAASDNDIIYIQPSATSYGSFTITKPLTIIGGGHNLDNFNGIRSTVATITLAGSGSPDVSGTKITGLNLGNINGYSYGTSSHNVHVINNKITSGVSGYFNGSGSSNWIIEGNFFESSYTSNNIDVRSNSDWQIRNNIFQGEILNPNHTTVITNNLLINDDPSGAAYFIVGSDAVTSPIVANNIFVFTDPDITHLTNTGSTPVTYTNCLTFKAGGGAALSPSLPGSGNLDNTDPLFTSIPTSYFNVYENDFTLQGASPAVGAATDNGDLGIFGRNFPFDINGRPHSMPYPESMTILNTVVQPGQDLNVEFQASQKN